MKLIFSNIIRKERRGGHIVFCPELGVYCQGETIGEAKANLAEAVKLYSKRAKKLGILEEVLEEADVEPEDCTEFLDKSTGNPDISDFSPHPIGMAPRRVRKNFVPKSNLPLPLYSKMTHTNTGDENGTNQIAGTN